MSEKKIVGKFLHPQSKRANDLRKKAEARCITDAIADSIIKWLSDIDIEDEDVEKNVAYRELIGEKIDEFGMRIFEEVERKLVERGFTIAN